MQIPQFGAMYLFSLEKTQEVMKYKDQYDLKYSGLDPLEENAQRDNLTMEANLLGTEESETLHQLTQDDVFQRNDAKKRAFITDQQGRADGAWVRGGLLSNGQLFVATNPEGNPTGKFNENPDLDNGQDDVIYWDQVCFRQQQERADHYKIESPEDYFNPKPNLAEATEHMIPDEVYQNALMDGKDIIEIE